MKYLASFLLCCAAALAQQSSKPLIFLIDHDAYEVAAAGNAVQAGIRPAHSEQVKDLVEECPAVTITTDRSSADYVVDWTLKTWGQTSWSGHQNEFAVYDRKGTSIGAGETHRASMAAKDICALLKGQK